MNAPLPSPRTMTASGRRQQSDDSRAPAHAAGPAPTEPGLIGLGAACDSDTPPAPRRPRAAGAARGPGGPSMRRGRLPQAPPPRPASGTPGTRRPRRSRPARTSDHATWPLLSRFRGKRPVLEGEPEPPAAALDHVPRLGVLGQRHHLVARRTAHPMSERGDPPAPCLLDAEEMARAVRALHEITRATSRGYFDEGAAVGAARHHRVHIPRSRLRRPRSKPTITSPSTVMTGTAIRPVFAISSSRAAGSSAT